MLETERIIANSHMISGESLPIIGPQAPQRHKSHFFDSTQFKKNFYFYCFKNYLFFGCTGSSLLRGLSLIVASGGYSLVVVHRLLTAAPALGT